MWESRGTTGISQDYQEIGEVSVRDRHGRPPVLCSRNLVLPFFPRGRTCCRFPINSWSRPPTPGHRFGSFYFSRDSQSCWLVCWLIVVGTKLTAFVPENTTSRGERFVFGSSPLQRLVLRFALDVTGSSLVLLSSSVGASFAVVCRGYIVLCLFNKRKDSFTKSEWSVLHFGSCLHRSLTVSSSHGLAHFFIGEIAICKNYKHHNNLTSTKFNWNLSGIS